MIWTVKEKKIMDRVVFFCCKWNLFWWEQYIHEMSASTDEMYFSTIRGEDFREYLDDGVWDCVCSMVDKYFTDNFLICFIT